MLYVSLLEKQEEDYPNSYFDMHGVENLELKLFIVILNFNGINFTINCLNSLKTVGVKDSLKISIVVVDNNSSDNSLEAIKKTFPKIKLISNKKNLGWAGGNNAGIRYSLDGNADCVLLLNNDVLVRKNLLRNLLKILYSSQEIGIVGPKSYFLDKKNIIADAGGIIKKHRFFGINRGNNEVDKGQYDKVAPVDFISGSAIMIKSEVFKKIGLLDNHYFLYYEDADFCLRARKAGFMSYFVPNATIYHRVGGTSKIGSPLHNYYTTRNHYLFVEKYAPFREKVREFLRTPKTILEFFLSKDVNKARYSFLGVVDYYLRRFGERKYWK